MESYFAFDRLITKNFVRALYFLGFVFLTIGGIALAVWAGWQLNDASIERQVGWRYVAIGAGAVILGNVCWRVFCELWIVLFNMQARLVAIDRSFGSRRAETLRNSPNFYPSTGRAETPVDAAVSDERYDSSRGASVLGLT
jgi:hypothetical protein